MPPIYVCNVVSIINWLIFRLEREVQRLKQDGAAGGVGGGSGGGGGGTEGDTALMHTLHEYDALKEEYECLRKRYIYHQLLTNQLVANSMYLIT